jgi:SAM-dependent methyltransferase
MSSALQEPSVLCSAVDGTMISENIYGHAKRLEWINSNLKKESRIVELGCGTGSMITIPLAVRGYQMTGIDLDTRSIEFGQELLHRRGLPASILSRQDLQDLTWQPDVVVASEVLEHLRGDQLNRMLSAVKDKLGNEGVFLVTVPNGYGWFEMESFLWFRTGLGELFERTRLAGAVRRIKSILFRCSREEPYPPSTLADSPHVQRFTYQSIQRLLRKQGFEVVSITGSVLFAGPFSNLFFTGIAPVMKLNCLLGQWVPRLAAGFYVACRPIRHSEK